MSALTSLLPWVKNTIKDVYESNKSNYPNFLKAMNGFKESGVINDEQLEEIKSRFPEVEIARGPDWSDDEESYLKDPDHGPLTEIPAKTGYQSV